jgi:CRP/FNR family cyclic AMP-dependent transcriptional regulator
MSRLAREDLVERTSRAIVLKNPLELSRRLSRALEG